jgi:DNA helicase-2/ATP-dependent DNA helicase PcrA
MKFQELYKQLNTEQKRAVDSIEGPVMVIAGPGTGKTQVLTLRIANILNKTDIDPENILALTFTESGAMSMKKRLISIIGNDAYRVNINTFHGFCNEIIQKYPEYFSNIAGFSNIDEIKQIEILRKVLNSMELKYLSTFNNQFFYLKEIKHSLEELKKESVSFLELRNISEKAKQDFENNTDNYNPKTGNIKTALLSEYKMVDKNIELSYVFEKYQEELKKSSYYDYSDMIIEVLNTFRDNQELLLIVQEQYQYILVDEYQDTNTSQNKILELLCNFHQNPNIFIVGDPKQAIFRFQGASIQNFDFFKSLYPSAIIIDLINNYRSSQLILDSAHFLINRDAQLKSCTNCNNNKIQIYSAQNPEQEAYLVTKKIKELVKNGVDKNDIAVLYRNHNDSNDLVEILEKFKIPFSIKRRINILNDVDIQKLLLILDTIYNYGNDEYLFKCMHIDFLNIDPLDIYKIINHCNQQKLNGYEFLNSNIELNLNSKDKLMFLSQKLKE